MIIPIMSSTTNTLLCIAAHLFLVNSIEGDEYACGYGGDKPCKGLKSVKVFLEGVDEG